KICLPLWTVFDIYSKTNNVYYWAIEAIETKDRNDNRKNNC
ncbi:26641_t:CDS:1, partial [Racocetra persica]